MIDKSKITEIVRDQLTQNSELFLVDVKVSASNEIEVIIDSDTNVNVETCIKLSRDIESFFDREQEDFQLTVTSAGIGQALRLERQLRKVLGKEVEVVLKSGIKLKGQLTEVEGAQTSGQTEGVEATSNAEAAPNTEAAEAAAGAEAGCEAMGSEATSNAEAEAGTEVGNNTEDKTTPKAMPELEAQSISLKYEEKVLVEGKKRKQTVETTSKIAMADTKSIKEIISFR